MSATSPDTSRTDCAAFGKDLVVSSDFEKHKNMEEEEEGGGGGRGGSTSRRVSSATPSAGRTRTRTKRPDEEYNRDDDADVEDEDDEDEDEDRASTYSHASAVNLDDIDDDDLANIHMHTSSNPPPSASAASNDPNQQQQRTLNKPLLSRQVLDLRRQSFVNSLARARQAKDLQSTTSKQQGVTAVVPQQQENEGGHTLMERCVTALTEVLDVNLTHAKMTTERFVSFQALYSPDERRVVAEILRETTARLRSERAGAGGGGGMGGKGNSNGGGGGWRRGTFLGKYIRGGPVGGEGKYYSGGLYHQLQQPVVGAMVDGGGGGGGGYVYGYAGLNEHLLQQQLQARASNHHCHGAAARRQGAYNVNPVHNNQPLLRTVALRHGQQQHVQPQYAATVSRDESGALSSSQSSHQLRLQQQQEEYALGYYYNDNSKALVPRHAYQLMTPMTTRSGGYNGHYYNHETNNPWISSPTGMYTSHGGGNNKMTDDMLIRSVVFGMHVSMRGMMSMDSTEAMLLRMAGEFQRDELTRRFLSHNRAERVDVPLSFAMTLTAALATFARLECVAGYKRYGSRFATNRRLGLPQAVLWIRTKYDGLSLRFGVSLHGESPCTVVFKRPRVFSLRKIDEYAAVVTEAKDILAEFGRDVVMTQQEQERTKKED